MKTGKLLILMVSMLAFTISNSNAQSKKEKIELLTRKTDSLERMLAAKNESLEQLRVKLAWLEGATDAHKDEIRRIENKTDSLKAVLGSKNLTIENQGSKIAQLNADINGLLAVQNDFANKNQILNAEIASLKQKLAESSPGIKDTKPADISKEDTKTAIIVADAKTDSTIKNK